MLSNPFSTRFVRPGSLPWIGDENIDSLAERLRGQFRCRAAIVGPHGTGKSTLLEHLVPRLGSMCYRENATGQVVHQSSAGDCIWLQLRGAKPAAAQLERSTVHWEKKRLLVLDGYEQLGHLARAHVVRATARNKMGLLVTAHRRTWLPTLHKRQLSVAEVSRIVHVLAAKLPTRVRSQLPLADSQLAALLLEHQGNLREVLMTLYDYYEQISGQPSSCEKRTI